MDLHFNDLVGVHLAKAGEKRRDKSRISAGLDVDEVEFLNFNVLNLKCKPPRAWSSTVLRNLTLKAKFVNSVAAFSLIWAVSVVKERNSNVLIRMYGARVSISDRFQSTDVENKDLQVHMLPCRSALIATVEET